MDYSQSDRKSAVYSYDFAIKVADNFDMNPDTLYGNNGYLHHESYSYIGTREQ